MIKYANDFITAPELPTGDRILLLLGITIARSVRLAFSRAANHTVL